MAETLESTAWDCNLVVSAAQLLDISEYEFFMRAYREWYREAPDERRIEAQFAAFMFADVVPCWVRDYARKLMSNEARNARQRRSCRTWFDALRFAWTLIAEIRVSRNGISPDFELPA